jgi:hypothetical protein
MTLSMIDRLTLKGHGHLVQGTYSNLVQELGTPEIDGTACSTWFLQYAGEPIQLTCAKPTNEEYMVNLYIYCKSKKSSKLMQKILLNKLNK